MEFGMFHEFQRVPGQTEEEAFTDSFEQVDAAERYGLDVMWLAELHTAPERSVLAAPLMLATAIAARTKRMKIGTAVQVLPLCHPLQLAEEVATVDHISHGTADLRRRAQRVSAGLSGVWRVVCGKPRSLHRGAGDPQARLDPGAVQLRRQVLPLPRCVPGAEAVSEAVSGDPRRGDQSRHLSGQRRAWESDLLRHAARRSVRAGPEPEGVSRGVGRRRAPRQRQGLPAGAGLCRADRGARAARSRKRA